MKVEGLGDNRRAEIFQIRSLVEEHDAFSNDQFSRMTNNYKKEDPMIFQILEESRQIAEQNYTRYLNKVIMNGKLGFSSFDISKVENERTVLGKVMSELRERAKSEKDYRKLFLGPQIGTQARLYDIQLRRTQKEEIKMQRDQLRALAKAQRKGIGYFNFGLK